MQDFYDDAIDGKTDTKADTDKSTATTMPAVTKADTPAVPPGHRARSAVSAAPGSTLAPGVAEGMGDVGVSHGDGRHAKPDDMHQSVGDGDRCMSGERDG